MRKAQRVSIEISIRRLQVQVDTLKLKLETEEDKAKIVRYKNALDRRESCIKFLNETYPPPIMGFNELMKKFKISYYIF